MADGSTPGTVSVEVTRREQRDIVRALRALADREEADAPGEADRLRGLAGRIERE